MNLRSECIYVSQSTWRNLQAAAVWLGLDSPDAAADRLLHDTMKGIPELAERSTEIRESIDRISTEWRAKYAPKPT